MQNFICANGKMCGNIQFVQIEDWSLIIELTDDSFISVLTGVICASEMLQFPESFGIVAGEIQYFDYDKKECIADFIFYKLGDPNEEWYEFFQKSGYQGNHLNKGYRTNG